MQGWAIGTALHPDDRKHVLAAFLYRVTGDTKPQLKDSPHLQFRDDLDWLTNTEFAVRKNGRMDMRVKHCTSYPTWPNGKPLRPLDDNYE